MDENIADISNSTESKSKTISSECKICGAPALYKNFGAVSCHACKIFFKRNAQIGLTAFSCNLHGDCEVNIYNRHVCTFCRLTKCFTCGMQTDLIRCQRQGNTKKSHSTKSITTNEQHQSDLSLISNLLDSNHSELNIDQRNLLVNLSQSYEEYDILSYIQQFIQEQINLPIKLRYKVASLDTLFRSVLNRIELFFKLNNNFLSLCSHDRSNLLRYAMENAGSFTIALILREISLFDYPDLTKHLPYDIAHDVTCIQLGIAMFVFSTTQCTGYSDNGLDYLTNIKDILRIQDLYVETTWKYLIYKYDHRQAVICFIYFTRSHLVINKAIIEIHQSEQCKQMIENLVDKINQQLITDT